MRLALDGKESEKWKLTCEEAKTKISNQSTHNRMISIISVRWLFVLRTRLIVISATRGAFNV
jgi:hypothetical protein